MALVLIKKTDRQYMAKYLLTAWMFVAGVHMNTMIYRFPYLQSNELNYELQLTAIFVITSIFDIYSHKLFLFMHLPCYLALTIVYVTLKVKKC